MSEITLSFPGDVPADLIIEAANGAAERYLRDIASKSEAARILADPVALESWVRSIYGCVPYLTYDPYPSNKSTTRMDPLFFGFGKGPVVMRGSLSWICTSKNHDLWAQKVFERYIRVAKITIWDWDDLIEFRDKIERRMSRKFGAYRHGRIRCMRYYSPFDLRECVHENGLIPVVFRGKQINLTKHQIEYLSKLDKIVRKVDALPSNASPRHPHIDGLPLE